MPGRRNRTQVSKAGRSQPRFRVTRTPPTAPATCPTGKRAFATAEGAMLVHKQWAAVRYTDIEPYLCTCDYYHIRNVTKARTRAEWMAETS